MSEETPTFNSCDAVLYTIATGEVRPARIVQAFDGHAHANLIVDLDGSNDTRYQAANRRELDAFKKNNPGVESSEDEALSAVLADLNRGCSAAPTPEECRDLRMWRTSVSPGNGVGQFILA